MKDYSRDIKASIGEANRLRDRLGTDPAKLSELADALVTLTQMRLLAGQLTDAVPQAQEALNLAVKDLASYGPPGPYTPLNSANRLVTAGVLAAAMQSLGGNQDAAEAILDTITAMIAALDHLPLLAELDPEVAGWALIAQAGDTNPSEANAAIDAAPRGRDFQEFFRLRALSAARWRAGHPEEAMAATWQQVSLFEEHGLPLLEDPGVPTIRLVPWSRVLPGLFGDLADRQAALGDLTAAIAARRRLVDYLAVLGEPLGDRWADIVAQARRGLADDLNIVGRTFEADELMAMPGVSRAMPNEPIAVPHRIEWEPTFSPFARGVSGPSELDLAEAARAQAAEHERAVAAEAARRAEAEAQRARQLAEQERAAEQARLAELERARLEAQLSQSEEDAAAVERAAIAERQRQRAERLAEHERMVAEQEAEFLRKATDTQDPVVAARAEQAAARTRGDKQGVFAATAALVEALRPAVQQSPDRLEELVAGLQELATAQRQAGDWWGSRKPAKEAKELAKRLNTKGSR